MEGPANLALMHPLPFLLCLLIGAVSLAQAPEDSDTPTRASTGLEGDASQPVRVVLEQRVLEGRLLGTSERHLTLGLGPTGSEREEVRLSDVRELSLRQRSTGYGAVIGGGTGLLAGVTFGIYVCSRFEYSSTMDCVLTAGALGGIGALLAAGVGAYFGFITPQWERVYESSRDGPLWLPTWQTSEPEQAWEGMTQLGLSLSNVLAIKDPGDSLGTGIRVEALTRLGPYVAVGPELILHYLFVPLDGGHETGVLASAGLLMRAAPRPTVLTPTALVGFAVNSREQPVTYSVGVGLDWRTPGGRLVAMDVRWHQFNLPWKGGRQLTLGVGTRLFW